MYWLQRPPYWRRTAAVLIVVTAVAWDLRSTATEPYPVAAHDLTAGTPLTDTDVDWIELPVDRLPRADLDGVVTVAPIGAGEPLTTAVVGAASPPPEGWWTVPLTLAGTALPGDEVLLVVADPPINALGIVVSPASGETYSFGHRPAVVAVPPDHAALVAAAEQEGLLVTAVRPRTAQR